MCLYKVIVSTLISLFLFGRCTHVKENAIQKSAQTHFIYTSDSIGISLDISPKRDLVGFKNKIATSYFNFLKEHELNDIAILTINNRSGKNYTVLTQDSLFCFYVQGYEPVSEPDNMNYASYDIRSMKGFKLQSISNGTINQFYLPYRSKDVTYLVIYIDLELEDTTQAPIRRKRLMLEGKVVEKRFKFGHLEHKDLQN